MINRQPNKTKFCIVNKVPVRRTFWRCRCLYQLQKQVTQNKIYQKCFYLKTCLFTRQFWIIYEKRNLQLKQRQQFYYKIVFLFVRRLVICHKFLNLVCQNIYQIRPLSNKNVENFLFPLKLVFSQDNFEICNL